MIPVVGVPIAMVLAAWVLSMGTPQSASASISHAEQPAPTVVSPKPTLEPAPTNVVHVPVTPLPLDTPDPCAGWDTTAVAAALTSVPYKDCGKGGPGTIVVTFAPSGVVVATSITAGDYDAATKSCIAGRFSYVKLARFCPPAPKTVGWGIDLGARVSTHE